MILLDTHAWIWWVSEPERLSEPARRAVDDATAVGISPISCWEIATKVAKGRLTLDRDLEVWIEQALAHPRVTVASLTPAIAVAAGRLGASGFHGDPADRILVATARQHGVALVTKDQRIRDYDGALTVW